ncbi:hypothetical protein EIN_373450 [Entamoeba invadens IP1]|uniref:SPRY domain-containing protein n=1 Tax=Entamoeba invadens IP1 TaxID=370355 RepID=A0A0A1TU23_ENTIV|nr:hypothetical protein EIN_373450 [Entamoeba invadens IP1]ELP83390.1 hypothetical protein EIN_373450 [Entamoeba invadens IP1]|eukprot:XP_004182736.1 hypothetical protein EIN_373450 [Entamoeba invadens IP1]
MSSLKEREFVLFILNFINPPEKVDCKVSNPGVLVTGNEIKTTVHREFHTATIQDKVKAFAVKITNPGRSALCNAMYVGMTFATTVMPTGQQWVKSGYFMSMYNGNLYSEKVTPNSKSHVYYNKRLSNDDSIVCWFNKDTKEIGFIVNGIQLGAAFTGVTQTDLLPMLVMYEADESFQVSALFKCD